MKNYKKLSDAYNLEADASEKLFGESRQKVFNDDGPRSDVIDNSGKAFDWPDEMKKHFKDQEDINKMMENRANSGLEEDI